MSSGLAFADDTYGFHAKAYVKWKRIVVKGVAFNR